MDTLDTARFHLLVTQIIFGCGYAVLGYDWLVCLIREYKLIWKMKWCSIKILYLFSRYWPLATVPYILWVYTFPHSPEKCLQIFRIPVAIATWNQLGAEAILLERTAAFLGNKPWITWALRITLSGVAAAQLWVVFGPMILLPFIPPATTGPCLPTSHGKQILGFFLSSLGFDTVVTLLMGFQVLRLKRDSGEWSRSPLVQLFVSEGLWYFFLAAFANLINGIFYSLPARHATLSALMVPMSNMVPNLLACRLILDLRGQGQGQAGNISWLTTGRGRVGWAVPNVLWQSSKHTDSSALTTIKFKPMISQQNPMHTNNSDGTDIELEQRKSMGVLPDSVKQSEDTNISAIEFKETGDATPGVDRRWSDPGIAIQTLMREGQVLRAVTVTFDDDEQTPAESSQAGSRFSLDTTGKDATDKV